MALFADRPIMSEAEALFVGRQRVAHLATVDQRGSPHVVPVSPAYDGDRLIIASESNTAKVRHVIANPAVSISFDEYSEIWDALKQVIVFGRAYLITTGMEFERDRNLLYEKYRQYEIDAPIEEDDSVFIEVQIDRVSTWGFA